jgi:hypothetical protein
VHATPTLICKIFVYKPLPLIIVECEKTRIQWCDFFSFCSWHFSPFKAPFKSECPSRSAKVSDFSARVAIGPSWGKNLGFGYGGGIVGVIGGNGGCVGNGRTLTRFQSVPLG